MSRSMMPLTGDNSHFRAIKATSVQDNMQTAVDLADDALYNIAAVERDTGLSKDTLRVWERRYGFPTPVRDQHDERLYSTDQLEKLRLLRLLIDYGHRPGKI